MKFNKSAIFLLLISLSTLGIQSNALAHGSGGSSSSSSSGSGTGSHGGPSSSTGSHGGPSSSTGSHGGPSSTTGSHGHGASHGNTSKGKGTDCAPSAPKGKGNQCAPTAPKGKGPSCPRPRDTHLMLLANAQHRSCPHLLSAQCLSCRWPRSLRLLQSPLWRQSLLSHQLLPP
jgi:hypothetical protein